jgi:hypothetical protein
MAKKENSVYETDRHKEHNLAEARRMARDFEEQGEYVRNKPPKRKDPNDYTEDLEAVKMESDYKKPGGYQRGKS